MGGADLPLNSSVSLFRESVEDIACVYNGGIGPFLFISG